MMKNFRLVHQAARDNAMRAVRDAPDGYMVEVREPRRSLDQNAAFWSAMHQLSANVRFAGEYRSPEDWRTLILSGWFKATGRTVTVIPGLEGEPVALGYHSSSLSKPDMSEVLDYAGAKTAEFEERAA